MVLSLTLGVGSIACSPPVERVITFSGSLVGREGEVIRRQLDRFQRENPSLAIALRATPDAADQRHQLYVQWLNARASDPDVLQLDVVWTAGVRRGRMDSAASIAFDPPHRPVLRERASPRTDGTGRCTRLPWFVDVGMLYWRTDLLPHAPRDLAELSRSRSRRSATHARAVRIRLAGRPVRRPGDRVPRAARRVWRPHSRRRRAGGGRFGAGGARR